MNGEKEQSDLIIKFTGKPQKPDNPNESSKWKQFLILINPFTKRTRDIAENYLEGEASKKQNEAKRIAFEAAEIAARTELHKFEKVRQVNKEITDIFENPNLPDIAKQLQLANLIANNPDILEQLKKLDDIQTVLQTVNFASFGFEVKKGTNVLGISARVNNAKLNEKSENISMRQLLKTPISELDLTMRPMHVLKAAEIRTIGELVSFHKEDLLKFKNFGKATVNEVEVVVKRMGLSFGMDISPYNLNED